MESPEQFFIGVTHGTTSLINSVAKGTLTSALTVVGGVSTTVAKSASYLSFDKEYTKKREAERRSAKNKNVDIVSGLTTGSMDIVSGISAGLTG